MSLLAKETLLIFCPNISNLPPMIMYSVSVPNGSVFEEMISLQIRLINSPGAWEGNNYLLSGRCIAITRWALFYCNWCSAFAEAYFCLFMLMAMMACWTIQQGNGSLCFRERVIDLSSVLFFTGTWRCRSRLCFLRLKKTCEKPGEEITSALFMYTTSTSS